MQNIFDLMTAQRIPPVKYCCQQDDFGRSFKVFVWVLLTILKNYGELLDPSSFSDSDRMFVQGLGSGTLLENLWPFYEPLDFFIYLIIRQNSRINMLSTLILSYLMLALAASTLSWEKLCIFRIDLSLLFYSWLTFIVHSKQIVYRCFEAPVCNGIDAFYAFGIEARNYVAADI